MDNGKKPGKSTFMSKPNKIHMDIREIVQEHALRFLPAKSLYRFKAVCRGWRLQISTPFFEHSQSFAFRSISGLFCQSPDGSVSFISLDPLAYGVPDPHLKFLPEPVDLLLSSDGLLCCRGRTEKMAYYICNPFNQKWKKLPEPVADHGRNPAVVLAFEPSLLDFELDYKLICAFPSTDFDGAHEFEIYSSVQDSWKISSEIWFGENACTLKAGGIYVNGVAYWRSNNYTIIGFDLKKNRVKVISYCGHLCGSLTLGIMGNKLCASSRTGAQLKAHVLSNEYANTMHMEAKSKTWEQKILLNHECTSSAVHASEGIVLAVRNHVIVFPDGRKIFSHDLRTKETKNVGTEFSCNNVYIPYVNSLVCL